MKNRDIAALLVFLLLSVANAKWFNRCELARIMKSAGLDRYGGGSLADWVCLAYQESKYNSRLLGGTNQDGGRSFGIFQVNSFWWCSRGQAKLNFGCHLFCSALLDDNIGDDIECAKKIASTSRRLGAWIGWMNHCRGKDLSQWVRNCNV